MASSRFIAVPSPRELFSSSLAPLGLRPLTRTRLEIATAPRKASRRGTYPNRDRFTIHTFGLFGRMYIEGRPPVTNLYSSALFIGWGAVLLCFATEKYLLEVASAMGSFIGAGTLVVAYNLSLDSSLNPTGDTMEMMRAVLIQISGWPPCGHNNHRLLHYLFGVSWESPMFFITLNPLFSVNRKAN